MKNNNFDLIVIGAGSGGLNIAGFMNKAGFKVLLIDKKDESIGGDCLNFGCVPSKAMIHVARGIFSARGMNDFGVRVSGRVDMKKIKEYIKAKQSIIREHENANYFRSIGMTVILGDAHFVSGNEVSVGNKIYKAKKIVIATGSRPRRLSVEGTDGVLVYSNENIFDIEELPKKLLIIGGGPIGIEIGQAFNHLGSKVFVIQNSDVILGKEDREISGILLAHLRSEGMTFHLNSNIVRFISSNEVLVEEGGVESKIQFNAVFAAVGRELNTGDLGIEKAGIEMDGKKIKVDEYLRTTNKNVYLCGDVVGQHQFTHAAELHAGVILKNLFSPFKRKLNTDHLSWVTYTNPEVATFGLNQEELKKRGIRYEILESDFTDDDRSIVDNFTLGKVKLFVSGGVLMGGTMIARNAGELFQELVLAQSSGLGIKEIFNKIYPYPTASRINKKVITKFFAGKLTPFNKILLRFLYH